MNDHSDHWCVRYRREDGYCTQYFEKNEHQARKKRDWILDTVGRDRVRQVKLIGPDV